MRATYHHALQKQCNFLSVLDLILKSSRKKPTIQYQVIGYRVFLQPCYPSPIFCIIIIY